MKDSYGIAILIVLFGFAILVLLSDIATNINHYNKKIDTVYTIRKIDKQRDTDTVIIKHTNYK